MVKKLNVTPKEKRKNNNNLCTTRPALLVKIAAGQGFKRGPRNVQSGVTKVLLLGVHEVLEMG